MTRRGTAIGSASSADHLSPDAGSDPWLDHLQSETRSGSRQRIDSGGLSVPTLTLVWHPSVDRIGEHVFLPELDQGQQVDVSRLKPLWESIGEGDARRPLADPRISRQPISIVPRDQGFLLDATATPTTLRVDGVPVASSLQIQADRLANGVLLSLADRVLILLHRRKPQLTALDDLGLVGRSEALNRVRRDIQRVAPLDVTVLISGESGTGKELVARAIQSRSRRRRQPFVSLNMAAVTPSLASAELFGAAKGAYSGANQRRVGYFRKAEGGTLLLDEIGEAPMAIQTMLLRTLETGDIQPVGAENTVPVNVRLLAATDADLENGVRTGRLSAPLIHRLATFVVDIPPLRQRREDIGSLILHFLRRELAEFGDLHQIRDPGPYGKPWLPSSLVERLILFDWPGNIRQLRNVIRQLVVTDHESETVEAGPGLERLLQAKTKPSSSLETSSDSRDASAKLDSTEEVRPKAPVRAYRDPSTVKEGELMDVLRRNRWQPKPAAKELGISRASLYGLIDRSSKVRKASELSAQELETTLKDHQGDLEGAAEALQVSKQGLKIRMRELGLQR